MDVKSAPPTSVVAPDRKQRIVLWTGLFFPGGAWLFYLLTAYVLSSVALHTGNRLFLHIASAVFLALTIGSGVLARREWRRAGAKWPTTLEGDAAGSSLLLGALGILSSVIFSLIIIGSWIAIAMLNPMQS